MSQLRSLNLSVINQMPFHKAVQSTQSDCFSRDRHIAGPWTKSWLNVVARFCHPQWISTEPGKGKEHETATKDRGPKSCSSWLFCEKAWDASWMTQVSRPPYSLILPIKSLWDQGLCELPSESTRSLRIEAKNTGSFGPFVIPIACFCFT